MFVCVLLREKEGVELDDWGVRKELGGVGRTWVSRNRTHNIFHEMKFIFNKMKHDILIV